MKNIGDNLFWFLFNVLAAIVVVTLIFVGGSCTGEYQRLEKALIEDALRRGCTVVRDQKTHFVCPGAQ